MIIKATLPFVDTYPPAKVKNFFNSDLFASYYLFSFECFMGIFREERGRFLPTITNYMPE